MFIKGVCMQNITTQIATVSKIDSYNHIWLLQGHNSQWRTRNESNQLLNPKDEEYAAVVEYEADTGKPISVSAPLALDVSSKTIHAHVAWSLTKQNKAQFNMWIETAALTDSVLKQFLTDVLSDSQIMHAFYQAKASKSFHHCDKGDLFLHSVQVAVLAKNVANELGLPKRSQDCVFVAGVLHDIGKVLMFYNSGERQEDKGVNGQHESFNFLVLAKHLNNLKLKDKGLFEVLSAILSPRPSNKRYFEYIEESVVRTADQLSAQKDEMDRTFRTRRHSRQLHAVANSGRRVKRISLFD